MLALLNRSISRVSMRSLSLLLSPFLLVSPAILCDDRISFDDGRKLLET